MKRYHFDPCGMHAGADGEWVRAEDREAILAQLCDANDALWRCVGQRKQFVLELAAANALLKKCSNQLELSELLARVDAHLAQRSGQ